MYLSYEEYRTMGGNLSETAFCDYLKQAEYILDYRTFNRIRKLLEIPAEVKSAIFRIISLVTQRGETMNLGGGYGNNAPSSIYITSQSNDGVSTTYNGMAATDLFKICDAEISQTIQYMLHDVRDDAGRKLLYRGLYPGE